MERIVIYQVLPRLFGNTNATCKPSGTIEENGCGKFADFTEEVLKTIKELSVTHIWYTGIIEHATATDYSRYGITPDNKYVVKGLAGSPYAIKDYYDVDPDLAEDVPSRMQEFEQLIARTHAAGMKVITDFVPNHVARRYDSDSTPSDKRPIGADDNPKQQFSPTNNFYYIPGSKFSPSFYIGEGKTHYNESPAKVTGNDCFSPSPSINDWYETVKLNYGIDYMSGAKHFYPYPDTWIKMRDILLYWASKGVDAFRCDMAEMVPVEFWQWCIAEVKRIYPEIIFIAEVYNPLLYKSYTKTGGFDYLYDKVGLYDTLRAVLTGMRSAEAITWWWQSLGDELKNNMLHFTENHDEQRMASHQFAGDAQRAFPLFALSALVDKCPVMLYFGQELGEKGSDAEGFSGADGRTTIFDYWSVATIRRWMTKGIKGLSPKEKALRNRYKKLLAVATREKGISQGEFFDMMYANYNLSGFDISRNYIFARRYQDELYLICVCFGPYGVSADIRIPSHMFEYWDMEEGEYECRELMNGETRQAAITPDGTFRINAFPYSTAVWKCIIKK